MCLQPLLRISTNFKHLTGGHVHDKLLHSTVNQLEVVLEGTLRECEGCSVAEGLGKSIRRTTSTRADKVFGRLFAVICGETSVASIGGKRWILIVYLTTFRASHGPILYVRSPRQSPYLSNFWQTNAWQEPISSRRGRL